MIKLKILITDDDLTILNSLKFILRNIKAEIDFIDNSEDAYNLTVKTNYDIILSDIEMPNMNGIEMIKKVKEHKELKKVIFMSSDIGKYKSEILKITNNYIIKPFKNQDILKLFI